MVFFLASWLVVSCGYNPAVTTTANRSSSAITMPSTTISPIQTAAIPASPTPAPTNTPTMSDTPTLTPSATEDLSFYNSSGCIPRNTSYQGGEVIEVLDGDTIEVQFTDGITTTVRYLGVDAPESGLPFYERAKQANADLVLHKAVILVKDQSETDPYDRLLRYVVVGEVFVNQELVKIGVARAVNYPPDESCKDTFLSAEETARQVFLGMWAPTPTPDPSAGQVIILTVNKREEWVDIQNVSNIDIDLTGWNLVSERGGQDCRLSGVLKSGDVLRVWAMSAQGDGYSCGYNSPIWNNSEQDPAVLFNAQGVEVSRK